MWSSREMKVSEDKEITVRTTIRELIVYGLFLTNLCIRKSLRQPRVTSLKILIFLHTDIVIIY
jgi:hypothetical protein